MRWMEWEDKILEESRFFSNDQAATLLLPHRTAYSISKRRSHLRLEALVHCLKCEVPIKRSNQWHLCGACSVKNNRKNNITNRFSEYEIGARRRGIEWDLTINTFVQLWNSQCTYCNATIEGIGIDRVDSSKPYTATNIVPCCTKCNKMKGSTSVENWLDHIKQIVSTNEAKDG